MEFHLAPGDLLDVTWQEYQACVTAHNRMADYASKAGQ
jgi:hypothetical protein